MVKFAGSNSFIQKKWIGQVVPGWNEISQDANYANAHNSRVKVRIPECHGPDLPNEQLPWALIEKPTSFGNFNGGTCGIIGGEWVSGYWLDSESPNPQIPVITGVFERNYPDFELGSADVNSSKFFSTRFKSVDRYNYWDAGRNARIGGTKPNSQASLLPSIGSKAKNPHSKNKA